ncbi:MAG: YfhO family protein, partial [Candidatus Diapherotrites archaeon]
TEHGIFALWNPVLFSGNSLIGNSQTALLHPLSLFLLWLEPMHYFAVIAFLSVFIAGLSMFFLGKELGLKKETSLLISFGFMFSGAIIPSMYTGHYTQYFFYAFSPLAFIFLKRILENSNLKNSVYLAISMALLFYAGFIQSFYYLLLAMLVFLLAFWVSFGAKQWKTQLKQLIFSGILSILLSLGHLLPMIHSALLSSRGAGLSIESAGSFSFPIQNIVTFILPNFFGNPATHTFWGEMYFWEFSAFFGGILLILFLFNFIKFGKNKYELPLLAVSVFSLLYSFGSNTPLFNLFHSIPLGSVFRAPARFIFLFVLSALVLAGFGLEKLLEMKFDSKKQKIILLISLLLLVSIPFILFIKPFAVEFGSYIAQQKLSHIPERMSYFLEQVPKVFDQIFVDYFFFSVSSAILLLLIFFRKKINLSNKSITLILALILFLNLFSFGNVFIEPKTAEEYAQITPEIEFLLNDSSDYRILLLDRTQISNQLIYFYGLEQTLGIESTINQSYLDYALKANGQNPIEENSIDYELTINEKTDLNVLRNLNTKYILSKKELINEALLLVFENNERTSFIYEIPGTKPRVFFESTDSQGTVSLQKINENHYLIETFSANQEQLVFSMAYYPGWKALIDGKEAKVKKFENALLMIAVPEGSHKVEFIFESPEFFLGGIISLATLVLILLFLFFRRRK